MGKTRKGLWIVGCLVMLLAGIAIATSFDFDAAAQTSTNTGVIRVSGDAVVTAAPDVAYISLGVETRDQLAENASQQNAEIMSKIIAALKEFGLRDQEITTSGYYIYSYQEPERSSDPISYYTVYTVRNQVNVRTNRLEDVGTIIDLAIKAGANQVQGISFDTENKAELQLIALENATRQAREKAEAIAKAAGVSIKETVSITEQSETYAPYTEAVMFRASAADSAKTPINPGDVEVKARVVIEYQF
ncbi:MAG TPA: SIMPL domain-containing protein [Firmicutes bacterium]|nr:SIMPL domain-containing protein [Bacillota bacterium]